MNLEQMSSLCSQRDIPLNNSSKFQPMSKSQHRWFSSSFGDHMLRVLGKIDMLYLGHTAAGDEVILGINRENIFDHI